MATRVAQAFYETGIVDMYRSMDPDGFQKDLLRLVEMSSIGSSDSKTTDLFADVDDEGLVMMAKNIYLARLRSTEDVR